MNNNAVGFRTLYIFTSPLTPIYMLFCVLGTIVLLPISLFAFGVSVRSDVVFGILVMLGAPIGDYAFRLVFKASMLVISPLKLQLIYFWPIAGLLVALFRPFE